VTRVERRALAEPGRAGALCRDKRILDPLLPLGIDLIVSPRLLARSSYTVLSRVRNLCKALQAMAPEEDWEWLRRVIRRRRRTAVSAKHKRVKIIATKELFDSGWS
jgi:hypothetical protein